MDNIIRGKAHVYGDDINTDVIIPGKYTKILDRRVLGEHAMEDLDENFTKKFKHGDILVAGKNFGCGSSREQAPVALQVAGVSAIISKFFARIFYRNAINIGLPALTLEEYDIVTGDELEIDLKIGKITNLTRNLTFQSEKMPEVMLSILNEGGLVKYLTKHGSYQL
ncbi:3-isopropylmalate dehydratase small subunit [Spirochaetota bacterium]